MTELPERNAVVAVYSTHAGAEEAVKQLSRAGIDMRSLSIVGKDSHTEEQAVGYYNGGDRMKYWGKTGAGDRRDREDRSPSWSALPIF